MEKNDCCGAWKYCCIEGKCVKPEMLDNSNCTTAKNLSRGINHLKRGELLLVDGNSFLHRCFHAFPPMSSPTGLPTNAVFGTLKMLEGLIGELNPTHLAFCLDASRQTWRHKLYKEYKANRKPAPQELVKQFSLIREVLSALNIQYYENPEYEADDLLGTIAQKAAGFLTRIATGDRDCIQLVTPAVRLIMYKSGGHNEMSKQEVQDKYGIEPWQMVHYKALDGDTSDNIPGVPGIGKVTALELIKQFGTIKQIATAVETIPGRKGKLLAEGLELMKMSYELAKIHCECPIEVDFDSLKLNVDLEKGASKLTTLGIKKINLDMLAGKVKKPTQTFHGKYSCVEKPIEVPEEKGKQSCNNKEILQLKLW